MKNTNNNIKHNYTGASLNELLKIYGVGKGGFYSDWWKNQKFADEKPEAGMYDIDFTKKLTNLTYKEQLEQLPKDHTMLYPAILAEAVLSHYKETGERLLEDWCSRTNTTYSDGRHVYVSCFDAGGLGVDYNWDDNRYGGIGVASAWKSIKSCDVESSRRNALKRAIGNRIKKHIGSLNSFIGNEGINHFPILVEELTDYFYEKLNVIVECLFVRENPKAQEKDVREITDDGKLKTSELLAECKKLFPVYSHWNDKELDTYFPVPKTLTTHKFRNVQEADEQWANKSADELEKLGIKGITLRERLIFELEYFKETGQHLDMENITLCSGSRYPDGYVPYVRWYDGKLYVGWCSPSYARGNLRVREQLK